MASQYFAILTDYGTSAFANALGSKHPLQLTTFAVGDGNGKAVIPTANRTTLAHETHRAPVSAVSLDPRNNKQVIVELTIPENVGGFYIREMGVFDNQNKLVAYANCPESFKPTESSGSGKVQVLRMILKVSSSSAVTLSVDHSVIFVTRQQLTPKTITAETQNNFDEDGHSHEIDQATTKQAGIVQLNSATNSTSETEAATPKAVKTVKDQLDSVSRNQANYIPNSKKSSSLSSPSSDTVATSVAVKTAYDKGVEALNMANNANSNANGRVSKSGDTIKGDLRINHANNGWSKLQLGTLKGLWEFEVNPNSHNENDRRFNMKFIGDSVAYLAFPTIGNGETVAYRSWVEGRDTPWNKIANKPAFATRWPNAVEQGYSHSLGRSGWTRLPSGLIIQWGEVSGPGPHKYPLAFNQVFQVFICDRTYNDSAETLTVRDLNNTSFKVWSRGHDMGAVVFFAVGK